MGLAEVLNLSHLLVIKEKPLRSLKLSAVLIMSKRARFLKINLPFILLHKEHM